MNDTTLISYRCDNAVPDKITAYEKPDSVVFIFHLFGFGDKNVTVYLIDKARGIAVFQTEYLLNGELEYALMVDTEKINQFPVIVNKCDYQKVFEMDFKRPDFEKLIKSTFAPENKIM